MEQCPSSSAGVEADGARRSSRRHARHKGPFSVVRLVTAATMACFALPGGASALGVASQLRGRSQFAPALTADPGAGSGFSIPESEFDSTAGVECPYPPCRPLRKDLVHHQLHQWKLARVHAETQRANAVYIPPEVEKYPPPLNIVSGGRDCSVCNDVLLGEQINPRAVAKMRRQYQEWRPRATELQKKRPFDQAYAAHVSTVETCFKAFSDASCFVNDDADSDADDDSSGEASPDPKL